MIDYIYEKNKEIDDAIKINIIEYLEYIYNNIYYYING